MLDITFDDMKDVELKNKDEELFEITNEFIIAGMSGYGGFNYAQLNLLGVETPPKTGWKERIIGKKIPKSIAKQYLDMKGRTKSVIRKENIQKIENQLINNKIEITEIEKGIIKYCVEEIYKLCIEKKEETKAGIIKKVLEKLNMIQQKEEREGTSNKSFFL